jgi:hypothetical protein
MFLYFDGFYFVSPYLVAYIDSSRFSVLLLDVTISAFSGIVLTLSAYEISSLQVRTAGYRHTGLVGVVVAFLAGACPCYYLVPLLAVAGGAGGALATLGILFYSYQAPIKFSSLGLLLLTAFVQERTLRAACKVPVKVGG